jgi:leader peptidase (prepilin peptidase) / N-methyltransferase
LWAINKIFHYWRGIDGMGEGDFDLLLFIGSFTGVIGCWFSVTLASILGSVVGLIYMVETNNGTDHSFHTSKIPFGPFLAGGALLFVFLFQFFLA